MQIVHHVSPRLPVLSCYLEVWQRFTGTDYEKGALRYALTSMRIR